MDDDEYAIVSKKEFLALKKEIEKLKKNPLEGSAVGENLQDSIDNLNRSVNSMLDVFKSAAQEMSVEEHDAQLVSKQIVPLQEKIDTILDQNQKIAKGIVAIADMVKERLDDMDDKLAKLSREHQTLTFNSIPNSMNSAQQQSQSLPPLSAVQTPIPRPMGMGMSPNLSNQSQQNSSMNGMNSSLPPLGSMGAMPFPGEQQGMGGFDQSGFNDMNSMNSGLPPLPSMNSSPQNSSGGRKTPILGGLLKR